jgi:hypothetical protein
MLSLTQRQNAIQLVGYSADVVHSVHSINHYSD